MANPVFSPTPSTREQLKDFCLRQLGFPVIEINVDDDQVEDAISLALQYFQDFHFDGVERWYVQHQITANDLTNKYVPITDNIIGITRVFPVSASSGISMFDLRYQLRLHELFDFSSTTMTGYVLTMQHLRMLDMFFTGEKPVRFNRHTGRLYIDQNWDNLSVGDYIILEGFIIIDPNTYTKVYNDRMLKRLATAYIKKQWGNNLKKFGGMQLPGGITLTGQQTYEEAVAEIDAVETLIRNTYEEPPQFIVG